MAVGPNQGFRSRLAPLRDPRRGEPRLAYFPHLYTLDLDLRGKYIGWPVFVNLWARARIREAVRFGMPLLIGEFGLDGTLPGAAGRIASG
jgi:endoglycosylceramidase